MTQLSVNLNKIALLRNSRGRDFPNVVDFATRFIELGVNGITIHPRQDERHIKRQDTYDLKALLDAHYPQIELNVEGYPSEDFLRLIEDTKPHQCTLVPDGEDQLTSDHGWQVKEHAGLLREALAVMQDHGVRSALFLDPDTAQVSAASEAGYDRIELYTEAYAQAYWNGDGQAALPPYQQAVQKAVELGLGVNAGHDLDLTNLADFLAIGSILEVSIGHALTVECILSGIDETTQRYLDICRQ